MFELTSKICSYLLSPMSIDPSLALSVGIAAAIVLLGEVIFLLLRQCGLIARNIAHNEVPTTPTSEDAKTVDSLIYLVKENEDLLKNNDAKGCIQYYLDHVMEL